MGNTASPEATEAQRYTSEELLRAAAHFRQHGMQLPRQVDVVQLLGAGGFGRVYASECTSTPALPSMHLLQWYASVMTTRKLHQRPPHT
jgi:hypothetical protein